VFLDEEGHTSQVLFISEENVKWGHENGGEQQARAAGRKIRGSAEEESGAISTSISLDWMRKRTSTHVSLYTGGNTWKGEPRS